MDVRELSEIENLDERRKVARRMIVEAAGTRGRIGARGTRTSHSRRTLQRAVFVCRQRGLVSPYVLIEAGFRAS